MCSDGSSRRAKVIRPASIRFCGAITRLIARLAKQRITPVPIDGRVYLQCDPGERRKDGNVVRSLNKELSLFPSGTETANDCGMMLGAAMLHVHLRNRTSNCSYRKLQRDACLPSRIEIVGFHFWNSEIGCDESRQYRFSASSINQTFTN
jgi:hypothetical protein